jgi:hypothetical protein
VKTILWQNLKYLFSSGYVLLHGYVLSINAADDTFYVNNNKNVTLTYPTGYGAQERTFVALSVKRTPIRSEDGTILNEIEVGLDNVDLAFKNEMMLGKYNNRRCKVIMIFAQKESTVGLGYMDVHMGFLDEPKGDEHWATFQIRPFSIFDRAFPNRIFQVGCNWTFCDDNCGLSLSSFTTNTTVGTTSNGTTIVCSHGKAANYFTPGFVQITSGTYTGLYRPILSNDSSSVTLRIPFDFTIVAGTNIRIVKLCARNPAACINIFNNYDAYSGFPHCPKTPIL